MNPLIDEMTQSVQSTDNLIEFLSQRLFPGIPAMKASVENFTDQKRDQATAYIEAYEAFEDALRDLSDATLQLLAQDEEEHDREKEAEEAERVENKRFFFAPSANADYVDWTQRECWTIDEAVALLLGKDPAVVSWDLLNPLVFKSRFAKRYADLRQQIKDAQASGEIEEPFTPEVFLHFAQSAGFVLPVELEKVLNPATNETAEELEQGALLFRHLIGDRRGDLETDGGAIEGERSDAVSDTHSAKEYELLLRIFHALAVSRYGIEIGSKDISIAKAIVAELEKGGLQINAYKVLKLLNDAAEVPPID